MHKILYTWREIKGDKVYQRGNLENRTITSDDF